MDPITAFGIATGVIQVVEFSLQIASNCREIHTNGALHNNAVFEDLAARLKKMNIGLSQSLDDTPKPIRNKDQQLLDIAVQCTQTADDLLCKLETIKPKGSGRRETIKATLKALVKQDELDEITEELDRYQRLLDSGLLRQIE